MNAFIVHDSLCIVALHSFSFAVVDIYMYVLKLEDRPQGDWGGVYSRTGKYSREWLIRVASGPDRHI
jgi:hypothetical protein